MRIAVVLLTAASVACSPPAKPVVEPKITPQELATRLAEADRLASRGCYLCLKEAAAAYSALLALTDDPVPASHALENNLMMVLREIELRLPDSGALEAATQLQARVPSSYAVYFAAIEALASPQEPVQFARGARASERRAMRAKLTAELEKEWPVSPMKAYFYLAMALNSGMVAELKPQLDSMLATHSPDLSLKYRTQAFLPLFSMETARDLIGQETGFGEMHFVIAQRVIMNGYRGNALSDAYRELSRATELLPDSAAISLVLANVLMAYARHADALGAFDRVLQAGPDDAALLGRAKALSYLRRHDEALAVLDELMKDLRTNPGEKYYWRAWNRLQLGQAQAALDDATAALNAMRNNQVYGLAGMAAFSLRRLPEARDYFDNALQMDRADCDSERYLGQIDSLERNWKAAAGRYSRAVTCYDDAIVQMRKDLAEYEQDITGLSNALIAAKREQIKDAETLRLSAVNNAAVASKNASLTR